MTKKPRNRSTRDKRVANARAQRQARASAERTLLHDLEPPFANYRDWYMVPKQFGEFPEYPFKDSFAHVDHDGTMGDTMDRLIKLGPIYGGKVPLAALLLDGMISSGFVPIAVTGRPGESNPVPVGELVAGASDREALTARFPDLELPEVPEAMADTFALHTHSLHAIGALILDDEEIVNLVLEKPKRGGPWVLNGHRMDTA